MAVAEQVDPVEAEPHAPEQREDQDQRIEQQEGRDEQQAAPVPRSRRSRRCAPAWMAGAVRPEQMRGGAVDREADLVADPDPAVAFVLGGDRLPVGKPRVDERPLAEPLDQLDLGVGRRRAGRRRRAPSRAAGRAGASPSAEARRAAPRSRPRRRRRAGPGRISPSPSTSVAGASVIAGEPTKRATKALAGRRKSPSAARPAGSAGRS